MAHGAAPFVFHPPAAFRARPIKERSFPLNLVKSRHTGDFQRIDDLRLLQCSRIFNVVEHQCRPFPANTLIRSSGDLRSRSTAELLLTQKTELPCLSTVCLRKTRHLALVTHQGLCIIVIAIQPWQEKQSRIGLFPDTHCLANHLHDVLYGGL